MIAVFIASGTGACFLVPKPYTKVVEHSDEVFIKTYKIYHYSGAPLDIADFSDISNQTVSRQKTFREAFFINQTKWSMFSVDNTDLEMEYVITNVRLESLTEKCRNELEKLNHYRYDCEKIDLNTEYDVYSHTTEKTKQRTHYVFCDNRRIVEIYFSWEPTEEEVIYAADILMNS